MSQEDLLAAGGDGGGGGGGGGRGRRRLPPLSGRKLSLVSTEVFARSPARSPGATTTTTVVAATARPRRFRRNSSADAATEESALMLREHLERQASELKDDLSQALLAGFVHGRRTEEAEEEAGRQASPLSTSGKMGRLSSRGRRRLLARAQTAQQVDKRMNMTITLCSHFS